MDSNLENYLVKRITSHVINEEKRRQMLNESIPVSAVIKWLPTIITLLTKLWPVLKRLAQNPKFEKYRGMITKLGELLNKFEGIDLGMLMNKAYANADGGYSETGYTSYGNTY